MGSGEPDHDFAGDAEEDLIGGAGVEGAVFEGKEITGGRFEDFLAGIEVESFFSIDRFSLF